MQKLSARRHFRYEQDFCNVTTNSIKGGYPVHLHDYTEITITVSGTAIHNYAGKEYQIKCGDVFVISGDIAHSFHSVSPDFLIHNVMYRPDKVAFPSEYIQKLPGYQALFIIEPTHRDSARAWLSLNEVQLARTVEIVHKLDEELKTREIGFEGLTYAWLLELLITLSRYYTFSTSEKAGGFLKLGETIAWLETNYHKEFDLDYLSRKAGMSERHFLRMFKKSFKTSPLQYVMNLRIRHACKLLDSGKVNISEAAHATGFEDSNYFSRQFRRFTGLSPRDYLRRISGPRS